MVYRNTLLTALLIAALCSVSYAGGSAFSGNGVGEQIVGGGTRVQGLGGGGFGLADSMSFNSDNPALAAFATRTLLRMAGQFGSWKTTSAGKTESDAEFLWKDFYVYFPATKIWRIGLGAVPQNRMDLRLFRPRTATFSDTLAPVSYEERDVWQGSRVDLRFDNSVRLSERLALGVSAGYVVLRDERDRTLVLPAVPGQLYYLSGNYQEIETFRGFTFALGGYYSVGTRVGLGVVFRPRFGGNWDYRITKSSGNIPIAVQSRGGHSPGEIALGASYRFAARSVAVVDLKTGQWQAGDLGIISDSSGTVKPVNPLFLSLGVERLAGHPPIHSGFALWSYRGGLFYRKHYWPLRNGEAVEDYGLTAGLSVPVAGQAGWVHVALDGGMRGRDETKLGAKETFFRGSLQLEMSETWFQRTKPRIPK